MVTATLLQLRTPWLLFHSCLLLALVILSGLPWSYLLRSLRLWGFFLIILFLLQSFFSPGPRMLDWLPLSIDGLRLGLSTCWRIGLILGYGILFTAVTRPNDLRDGLIWFLKPFPFLPKRRISLMVSLTLRFFSLLLDQVEEVRLAYRARLGDRRRNPFRMAKSLGLPILRRSFLHADEVTFALAARGYREDIPFHLPGVPNSHWIPLAILLVLFILLSLVAPGPG